MNRFVTRFSAIGLAAALTLNGLCINVGAAGTGDLMPVAGVARVLGEGKSVTAVKAEKIKKDESSDSSIIRKLKDEPEISAEDVEFGSDVSSIKENVSSSDPAIVTVGAESAAAKDEPEEKEEIKTAGLEGGTNLETEDIFGMEAAEEDESQEGEYLTESEVFTVAAEEEPVEEEEDFSNLVIARVNDYVNVRSEPDENSEAVGKLYNKSVGDLIEEAGEWYKIRSGNCTGYVKGEYVVTGEEAIELAKEVGTRMAVVTTTTLYVREAPSTGAEVIGMVPIEDELLVMEELEGWAKVSVEEGDGYVSTDFVRLYTEFVRAESKEEEEARLKKEEEERKAAEEAAKKAREKQRKEEEKKNNKGGKTAPAPSAPALEYQVAGSGNGSSVANFALKFVGNPYVYGGCSLTSGTDCSGFVMSVYRNFGVNLPHSSGGDRGVGRDVGGIGNAQAGDIVCYSGHVGIYIGNGQIVHASTPATGIKVSNANYRQILAVRRIF